MSCNGCDEIITTGNQGYDGWSPVLALSEDCAGKIVHRLISWIDGTGTKPDYNGNIMTDAWLLANPIYLSTSGFTEDCDEAVNLQPSNGTNGTNGTNGEQGPPGEDGCTPEISFTANVGDERPVECNVEGVIDGCTSSWNINFPEEIFTSATVVDAVTGSETFTTAVENAIDGVLNPTPIVKSTSDPSPLQIGTTTQDIKYTTAGLASLSFNTSLGPSYIQYSIIGNKMYLNFRLFIDITNGGVTPIRLEIKIPNGNTSQNYFENNAIYFKIGQNNIPGIISTNSSTSNSYLILGSWDGTNITISTGTLPIYAFGQITFTIN
jgi:hypothetical protein